jgi:rifampicin phosphotransferase
MVVFESLSDIDRADSALVGSKAKALANLAAHGFEVPSALCISAEGYDAYMSGTNLRDRVLFELGRKRFEDMRWEEVWDAALRIRNLFLTTPLPAELHMLLLDAVTRLFGDAPVVVRSSAPGEDSADASFAGLHESFVNVRGPADVLKHVRLVWASLWSDAALLYRQELGLDVRKSRMAVIVQAMVEGECSGVAFSRDPNGADHAVIEAVYGLNAGLVDGTIEPDRWTVDRRLGRITSHKEPKREHAMLAAPSGIARMPLDAERSGRAPLAEPEVESVYKLALSAEQRFGAPQDVEWTRTKEAMSVLQSRPITTLSNAAGDDKRPWYRSLTRSFENLRVLRRRIEDEIVPGMRREAAELARTDPAPLTDVELAAEVKRREEIYRRWRAIYWDDCIPFAHGVRLFGQYYNDLAQPRNPYEFMDLLGGTAMLSVARNRALEALARMIRDEPALGRAIRWGDYAAFPAAFREAVDAFLREHGAVPASADSGASAAFLGFLLELADASRPGAGAPGADAERLRRDFLASVPDTERAKAEEMLDLARASHRWRDDDNVYLDAVEAQWRRAADELRRRNLPLDGADGSSTEGTAEAGREDSPASIASELASVPGAAASPRQLVGQPAGPGVATGRARVVARQEELLDFKRGDVLVCDALSPTMTFVIPLASAVVERRGGMLIHGAIIAREYGIPCVTGVPDAAELIRTGMRVTVDGYLGIVRVGN